MSLLERHLGLLEALRGAGLGVSLAEGLDAVAAVSAVRWDERETVREAYAATCVKRQAQRATFDALFDLWFPARVGEGGGLPGEEAPDPGRATAVGRDSAEALGALTEQLLEAMLDAAAAERGEGEGAGMGSGEGSGAGGSGGQRSLTDLATEAVARFGSMPGRGPGLSQWSSHTALRRVDLRALEERLVQALVEDGWREDEARRAATRITGQFKALVEADARRRLAEDKGPRHVAQHTVRPTLERLDFLSARREDLDAMRREIAPLARRLATRLSQEHHAAGRGPLDFRRTVRASMATGGVPLTTHHRPRRPHRSELVVLCDVSGSVSHFASFTLLLVHALRDQFTKVRAFTFVDQVVEVSDEFVPGADPAEVLQRLAAASAHAARWGRTNYGRAFGSFTDQFSDALTPRTTLLVLGDARSNYADLNRAALREMVEHTRQAWWLNPEHRRHWDTGDSAATAYGELVPMSECRNLVQLGEFVHDLAR